MNTHKEEPKFKVGDRVMVIEVENSFNEMTGKVLKYDKKTQLFHVMSDQLGQEIVLWEYELAPVEPKEELCPGCIRLEKDCKCLPIEPTPPSQIEEESTEARLLKLEQEMAELYPRVEDLVRKVFNNTK